MTTLHTISKSWHDAIWLYEQTAFASHGDAIVLIQDAVLAADSPLSLASFLAKCNSAGVSVFVLSEDCALRGIDNKYAELASLNYLGLVALACQHSKQVAW